jgi:hypothetical protein
MSERTELDRCWPWLEASMLDGPTHTKEHIWKLVENGRAHLFPGPDHAALTELLYYPTGLKRMNMWLVGGKLESIKAAYPEWEEWAKYKGCHDLVGTGRRGWLRELKGWEEIGIYRIKRF